MLKDTLKRAIYEDIKKCIVAYYDMYDIKYKDKKPEEMLTGFLSYCYCRISSKPRQVHISATLKNKIDNGILSEKHIAFVKKFKTMFELGQDMNGFSSNNTKNVREPDFLLYTWHLYHLHLSNKVATTPGEMKRNRSDTQLLCIIDKEDTYFVDVITHPKKPEEYFDICHLETIINNGWIEKIGFSELEGIVPGSMEPKIRDCKDFFTLYSKASINLGFEYNGHTYFPIKPLSMNRQPFSATQGLISINKNINRLANQLKSAGVTCERSYRGSRFCATDNSRLLLVASFVIEDELISYNLLAPGLQCITDSCS